MHPYPKKLLVLLPAHIGNPTTTVQQANAILGRFLEPWAFRVVCVTQDLDESIMAIQRAVGELGVQLAAG